MKTIKIIVTVLALGVLNQFASAQCPPGKVRMLKGTKGNSCHCSTKCVSQADVATYQANGWYFGECLRFCPIGWRSADVHDISSESSLSGVYPNPANGPSTVFFSLSQTQKVTFTLFDVTGRMLTNLGEEVYEAGENEFIWNTSQIPSGVYFLQMATDSYNEIKKVSVVN